MDLRNRADKAMQEVRAVVELDEGQARELSRIVERAIIDAVREASQRSQSTAQACAEADRDLAYKLAQEIERANTALIANLSAMR